MKPKKLTSNLKSQWPPIRNHPTTTQRPIGKIIKLSRETIPDAFLTSGQYLAECRRLRKLSQARVAELVDVTIQAISSWERNKAPLPKHRIQQIYLIVGFNRTTMINLMVSEYREELADAIKQTTK